MVYVALLRGINVGGKNIIEMKQLKELVQNKGFEKVATYINSGNLIFTDTVYTANQIRAILEEAVRERFGLDIKILLRSLEQFRRMMDKLPPHWRNDSESRCDILFLEDGLESAAVMQELVIKPWIDTVISAPGALLWWIPKSSVTKSGLLRLLGTALYKSMTIRNVNTVRKLYALMRAH